MIKIARDVYYYTRDDWGADKSLPRLGQLVDPLEATELIEHHTVQRDDDLTPTIWESPREAIVKMRDLQTMRAADLGADVPYSWVRFLMKYPTGRSLLIMEGRGAYRRGAHTMYHNRTGRATATAANLMLPTEILPYVPMINEGWGWLKREFGLRNLGTVTPADRVAFGHRDFRDPDDRRTWTLCPGAELMAVIHLIRPETLEEAEMTNWKLMIDTTNKTFQGRLRIAPHGTGAMWLVERVVEFPYSKRLIAHQEGRDYLATLPLLNPPAHVGAAGEYHEGHFDTIPIVV